MSTRITDITIVIDNQGMTLIAKEVQKIIKKQSGDGVSSTGGSFPSGVTKNPLTMYDTGRMQDTDVRVTAGKIEYFAPYAQDVQNRYRWAGVSNNYMPELERNIQGLNIDQYITSIDS